MLVTIVNACLRDGRGGSPTAVLADTPLTDAQRRSVPALLGTSHAAFVAVDEGEDGRPLVSLRFFTAEGELPACGHGTVAALAFLAERAGGDSYEATLRASGRSFAGQAAREGGHVTAAFDPGPVDLREAGAHELELVLPALGAPPDTIAPGACVASVGRPRLLVPISSRSALAGLDPDQGRLRDACEQLDLLGCYVHTVPEAGGRIAARMFAPAIGVPEDIANANSTACLAARLAREGITELAVDMGDSLGDPATITATAARARRIRVGGAAAVGRSARLTRPGSARDAAGSGSVSGGIPEKRSVRKG